MDYNLNINGFNHIQQPNTSVEPELNERMTTEEAQYRYLKELNQTLTLFKKQGEQSEKKDEETKQTMRR